MNLEVFQVSFFLIAQSKNKENEGFPKNEQGREKNELKQK